MADESIAGQIRRLISPRKLIVQLIGFCVGIALLAWCIWVAISRADWTVLEDARADHIALLVGCTVISLLVNGSAFWVTIRPVRNLNWGDLQALNAACSMLNYAPIRIGALSRLVYHRQVDGMGYLEIAAWFAFFGMLVVISIGAWIAASLLYHQMEWLYRTEWLHYSVWFWPALALVLTVAGGIVLRFTLRTKFISKYGPSLPVMAFDPGALWGGMAMRLIDLCAYTGRIAAALLILDIDVELNAIATLGVIAFAVGLVPFGKLGIREWTVLSAAQIVGGEALTDKGVSAQLAIVESLGEAIVYLPAGLMSLWWFRRRWNAYKQNRTLAESGTEDRPQVGGDVRTES